MLMSELLRIEGLSGGLRRSRGAARHSLALPEGDIAGPLGRNGTQGKTTLINTLVYATPASRAR